MVLELNEPMSRTKKATTFAAIWHTPARTLRVKRIRNESVNLKQLTMRKTKFLWLALALMMLCYHQGSAGARTTNENNNSPQTAGVSLPIAQNEMSSSGGSTTATATKGRCAFFFSDPDGYVIIRKGPSANAPEVKRLKESNRRVKY